jgi:flagellar M-ring protein FliF
MVYQERGKEQLDRIATLVRSAIGFDQKRGDQVEVVNLKFAEAPVVVPFVEPTGLLLGMFQFTKDDVMYVIELGVMMLLGLVVLFMVIRPLVRRILAAEVIPELAHEEMPALTDGSTGQNLIPGANATAQMIDVAQVQGQVHAQSVHRVGELAERNPNETASIVRQWLSEPAT